MISRKRFVLIVVALIVIGALLHRDYPAAGLVVSMVAIGVYVAAGAKRTYSYLRHFREVSRRKKLHSLIALALLLVLLSAGFGGSVSYFILLVLLAAEYMIYDGLVEK